MRRLAAAALSTTLATSLLLAGCTNESEEPEAEPTSSVDPTAGAQASPEDVAALESVEVEGEVGSAPELTFDQPFDVSSPVAIVETEGDGEQLADGQRVTMHYLAVRGDDGTPLTNTWDLDAPETITLGDEAIVAALTDTLREATVGSRILFAAPGGEAVEATEATPAQEAYPATVMAIEVVEVQAARAQGEPVEPAPGLPLVTLAESGEPEIVVPEDAEEPSELVVQTLIQGEGPPVEAGQQILVHYKGWLWDGTLFDSSWNGQPFPTPIGTQQLIAGWDEGLVGQNVGSQVLLVVPADKGYGAEGMGDIPGDATLIFVVDILEAQGPAAG